MSWVMITVPNNTRLTWKRVLRDPLSCCPIEVHRQKGLWVTSSAHKSLRLKLHIFHHVTQSFIPHFPFSRALCEEICGQQTPPCHPCSDGPLFSWLFPETLIPLQSLKALLSLPLSVPQGSKVGRASSLLMAHFRPFLSLPLSKTAAPAFSSHDLWLSAVGPASSWRLWLWAPGPALLLLSSGCLQQAYKWTVHLPGLCVSCFCPPSQPQTSTPPVTP